MSRTPRVGAWLLVALLSLSLSACFDGGKPAQDGSAGGPGTPEPVNRAPTISGSPVTTAKTNAPYSFQPNAADPDGDVLTFSVANKPAWAAFDTRTGRLSGTPSSSSTGRFSGIRIVASDGLAETALGAFDITVSSDTVTGSATLSWNPPLQNVDGTPLTNLAGYIIRYGLRTDALDKMIRLANPGLTSAVVEGLTAGTWYFTLSSYTTAGVESAPSGTGSKTIG